MKRQSSSLILWAVLAWMSTGILNTNAIAQGRWGIGLGPSINSLYGDLKKTSIGIGFNGYLTRRLNSHFGITGVGGYGQLPFTIPTPKNAAPIQNSPSPGNYTTNIIRGDLLFDYELGSSRIRPYIGLGGGVVNFQVKKDSSGIKSKTNKRFNNFDFGPNLGFRVMLGSRAAFDLGGGFRYTTGDGLDLTATKKAKDAIISGMLGFTLFFGGGNRGTDIIAEQRPIDETSTTDLDMFKDRIDQMDSTSQQPQQDMQEYVRLKSKMDELNQQINQKDGEINTLRSAVAEKEQSVNAIQTQLASTPVNSASFSRGYEEALSKFYGKRYTEAIDQFNGIVAQFPDHPRVSNCVYWIGESHFGAGNYREAVNAFSRVLNYPRSLKRDDALLMLGRSYAQMNQKTEAREAFNRLIAEYPNSEFVAKAQEWLSRL